jgi:hypothetical protein
MGMNFDTLAYAREGYGGRKKKKGGHARGVQLCSLCSPSSHVLLQPVVMALVYLRISHHFILPFFLSIFPILPKKNSEKQGIDKERVVSTRYRKQAGE